MTGLLVWVDQTEKAGAAGQNAILEHYLANRQCIDNRDLVDVTCPPIIERHVVRGNRTLFTIWFTKEVFGASAWLLFLHWPLSGGGLSIDTFALAEVLLPHRHDLIHKTIGWMLREIGKRNIDFLEEFLHDHV